MLKIPFNIFSKSNQITVAIMDISEFIKETIKEVSDGVFQASIHCSQSGVIVNPTITVGENGEYFIPIKPSSVAMQRRVQKIDFDIAVEATETEQSNGHAGVSIKVVSGGGSHSKESKNTTVSRICFSIPVCLPTQDCFDE